MFTSFSERLKQAAQAGVESFDSAGQALQKTVSQAHLPVDGSLGLPRIPNIPGLGINTDVGPGDGGSRGTGSPNRAQQVTSPTGERRSIDSPRNSALANRLSSLVASSAGSTPTGKNTLRQTSRPTSPSLSGDLPTRARPRRAGPVDPASIPLPPSPPPSPPLRATSPYPASLPKASIQPSFLISDSNPGSSVGTPLPETSKSFPDAHSLAEVALAGAADLDVSLGSLSGSTLRSTLPQESRAVASDSAVPPPKAADLPSADAAESTSATHAAPLATGELGGTGLGDTDVGPPLPPVEAAVEDLPPVIPTDPAELTIEYAGLAERVAKANAILAAASPMLTAGIADPDALSGWLQMVNGKVEMGATEMKRLAGKLELQEGRLEELRDTHRLESTSSTELISQLREQLAQQERSLSSQADQAIQIGSLRSDLAKSQTQAKDAEEKTSKAIALLKTVRSKLVKVEKERDEVEKLQAEDRNERSRMVDNLEKLRAEREKEVVILRQGFEKELAAMKEKFERDLAARKGQWELDIITTKASHAKELAAKSSRITTLTNNVTALTSEKQAQFSLLQQRQEDVEAARSVAEGHETRMKELEFQLREATDRAASAEETVSELRRELQSAARSHEGAATLPNAYAPAQQVQDIPRLLAEASAKAEVKMANYRAQLSRLEKDRLEAEEEHARQLRDRMSELERLRTVLAEKDASHAESLARHSSLVTRLEAGEADKRALRIELEEMDKIIRELRDQQASVEEVEAGIREEMEGVREQLGVVQGELEEARNVAAQMRGNNRTLREEMRRIQSSAQLLERQRNPGVGYWSAGHQASASASGSQTPLPETPVGLPGQIATHHSGSQAQAVMSPTKSVGGGPSSSSAPVNGTGPGRTGSPAPSEVGSRKDDEEEVNLEYLRNVILQFLEHKEMRANLVRVLAVILRFTPQELRRLNAKLTS